MLVMGAVPDSPPPPAAIRSAAEILRSGFEGEGDTKGDDDDEGFAVAAVAVAEDVMFGLLRPNADLPVRSGDGSAVLVPEDAEEEGTPEKCWP